MVVRELITYQCPICYKQYKYEKIAESCEEDCRKQKIRHGLLRKAIEESNIREDLKKQIYDCIQAAKAYGWKLKEIKER